MNNFFDFLCSLRDGLVFCKLVNLIKPGLLSDTDLNIKDNNLKVELVLNTAERALGIPKVLDAQDVVGANPDPISNLVYLTYFVKKVPFWCEIINLFSVCRGGLQRIYFEVNVASNTKAVSYNKETGCTSRKYAICECS